MFKTLLSSNLGYDQTPVNDRIAKSMFNPQVHTVYTMTMFYLFSTECLHIHNARAILLGTEGEPSPSAVDSVLWRSHMAFKISIHFTTFCYKFSTYIIKLKQINNNVIADDHPVYTLYKQWVLSTTHYKVKYFHFVYFANLHLK